MKLNNNQMKELALAALKQLGVCYDYIYMFKFHDVVTMFIEGGGYYIDDRTEDNLLKKIREIEQEYHGRVYAVIKNIFDGDTIYTFLWVSENEKENNLLTNIGKDKQGFQIYETFVYGYNATCEYCSEFGYACIINYYGGLKEYI